MSNPDAKYCPREPTQDMIHAALVANTSWERDGHATYRELWRAMYDAAQAEHREWTPPREMVKHVQPYRYEAAPSPAAEDGLVDLGEPDAWLHEDPSGISTLWCERPDGDPPGCLIALYAEPRIEVAYAARIERLVKELRIAEAKSRGTLANNLCSDHRDKQSGKPCLACEIERQAQEIASTKDAYRRQLQAQDANYVKACADLVAAIRRAEALHTALRGTAIDSAGFNAKKGYDAMMCLCCSCKWRRGAPEEHAEGCLASPAEKKE